MSGLELNFQIHLSDNGLESTVPFDELEWGVKPCCTYIILLLSTCVFLCVCTSPSVIVSPAKTKKWITDNSVNDNSCSDKVHLCMSACIIHTVQRMQICRSLICVPYVPLQSTDWMCVASVRAWLKLFVSFLAVETKLPWSIQNISQRFPCNRIKCPRTYPFVPLCSPY